MHTAIQTPPAEMLASTGGDYAELLSGVLDSLNSECLWRIGDRDLLAGTRELLLCLERLRAETSRRVAEIEARGAAMSLHGVRTSEWLHATNWSNLGDARRQVRAAVELAARPDVQAEALAGRVGGAGLLSAPGWGAWALPSAWSPGGPGAPSGGSGRCSARSGAGP